jgi:hypothetical protein
MIYSSIAINNVEGKNIREFVSKQGSGWNQCHLTYDWNMNALATIEAFIAKIKMHKVLIIIMHTTQVTQATSLLEV